MNIWSFRSRCRAGDEQQHCSSFGLPSLASPFLPKQRKSDSVFQECRVSSTPTWYISEVQGCYTAPRSWIFQSSCLVIQFAAAPMRAISGPLCCFHLLLAAKICSLFVCTTVSGTFQCVPLSLDHCKEV